MSLTTFLFLFTHVFSHSWLECTKYEGDLVDFEADKCLGRPRPLNGNRNVGGTFGQDIGMDFRPSPGGNRCQGSPTTGTPTQVTYEAGKTYTLAWPPKNHVAADCANANIPDTFLKVYMAPYNGATDPTQDEFKENQVQGSFSDDPHVRGQVDYKGFQNCPDFCNNRDKALCTGEITIPADAEPGVYTFQWYWAFNSETDLYATCWEAEVAEATDDGTGGETGTSGAPEITNSPVQEETTTTSRKPCFNCCEPWEEIAQGTGSLISIPAFDRGTSKYVDCPQGYNGQLKYMCLENAQMSSIPRFVDGFCEPEASSVKDQQATVTGLSLALTFTIIAFILYVLFTQGILTMEMIAGACKTQKKGDSEAPIIPPRQPEPQPSKKFEVVNQRGPAKSVISTSNTELPVMPETPEWHYVNENDDTVGPVTLTQFRSWVQRIGLDLAKQTFVWNGKDVSDWTQLSEVQYLYEDVQ